MQPLPLRLIEIGLALAVIVGVLIVIAPNFGMKPKQLVDGWRFPVKPTCLLLYYLALGIGKAAGATLTLIAEEFLHAFLEHARQYCDMMLGDQSAN